ncbi:MAG: biopolymer transporter ExbD [Phycisphaerales bacterium]|nr:biopolymer transporter ExbD [Phycisphaerales bacterium]
MAGRRKIGMQHNVHVGPNMTPMVDVVMVILIFFMLGSSFSSPDWYLTNNTPAIKGGLSHAKTKPMPATRLIIKLEMRGTHTMASLPGLQTEDLSGELYHRLEAKRHVLGKDVQVLIKPSEDVPYQDLITVYSDCVGARYQHVAFYAPA